MLSRYDGFCSLEPFVWQLLFSLHYYSTTHVSYRPTPTAEMWFEVHPYSPVWFTFLTIVLCLMVPVLPFCQVPVLAFSCFGFFLFCQTCDSVTCFCVPNILVWTSLFPIQVWHHFTKIDMIKFSHFDIS